MDDAARRVNPAPLRALLRLRERREESALRAVRAGLAERERAEQARAAAADAVVRHETFRAGHEAGLLARMRNRLQTADRLLQARDQLEWLADQALRLDAVEADAAQVARAAEAALQRARMHHADCLRRREKWRRTVERVRAAHAAAEDAAEEVATEDETADRRRLREAP